MSEKYQTISLPVHPDEVDVPVSIIHVPLSSGRYATFQGPLAPKTLKALLGTLEACKDCLISKPDDFSI